jgi:hypothetical protein
MKKWLIYFKYPCEGESLHMSPEESTIIEADSKESALNSSWLSELKHPERLTIIEIYEV